MSGTIKKILWRIVQVAIIGIIFYYLGKQLYVNWGQVVGYDWELNYTYLVLSTVSVIFTFFVISTIWRWIIHSFGKELSHAKSFKISYLSNLGRYVPGKIWQVFGIVYLARKEGITEAEAMTAFGVALTFTLPPAFFSGFLYLILYPSLYDKFTAFPVFSSGIIFATAILVVCILLVMFPEPFEKLLNKILTVLRRKPIRLHIDKWLAVKLYLGYFLAWSLYGFSFWLFLKGITTADAPLFPVMGLFIISYQVGYLALFAPGGIGPREFVMQAFLAPIFGPVATAIAFASRLWLIIAEALAAAIAWRIK